MNLLPSEQKQAIEQAIGTYEKYGELDIYEPCNCGSHIRHNNGGNYHEKIFLKRDLGKDYIKEDSTCKLNEPAEWEICKDIQQVIKDHADWL